MPPELRRLLNTLDANDERFAESRRLYESLEAGQRPKRVPVFAASSNEQTNVLALGTSMGEYRSSPEAAFSIEIRSWIWRLTEFPEEDVRIPRFTGHMNISYFEGEWTVGSAAGMLS